MSYEGKKVYCVGCNRDLGDPLDPDVCPECGSQDLRYVGPED